MKTDIKVSTIDKAIKKQRQAIKKQISRLKMLQRIKKQLNAAITKHIQASHERKMA